MEHLVYVRSPHNTALFVCTNINKAENYYAIITAGRLMYYLVFISASSLYQHKIKGQDSHTTPFSLCDGHYSQRERR